MNRLPCCDRATHRSEVAVFLSLGLAGVMMVAMAATQMTRFVAGGDRIAAAFAARQASLSGTMVANNARRASTNAESPVAARHGAARGLAVTTPPPPWR